MKRRRAKTHFDALETTVSLKPNTPCPHTRECIMHFFFFFSQLLLFVVVDVLFFFSSADPYGNVAGYPSTVGYGSANSPTSNGHFAMPPCPPAIMIPGGAGTAAGRGSVIQAANANNCYQPTNGAAAPANLNDLYYVDFGAHGGAAAAAAAAAMYHQKAVNNKIKKPKKYNAVGRPVPLGSSGVVQQSPCPATGPKRKSREGKGISFGANVSSVSPSSNTCKIRILTDVFRVYRLYDVPVGVFAKAVAEFRLLPEVYKMVEPGKGRIQIGRLQSGV